MSQTEQHDNHIWYVYEMKRERQEIKLFILFGKININ